MSDLFQQAQSLFLAALDKLPGEERHVFVAAACAGRPELLERVRALVQAHEESHGPLDVSPLVPPSTADAPAAVEQPGMVVGPYKLLQKLGEGGMGAVFLAEQTEPVRRRVAVKLIKPGLDSAQVLARFEAERQALALMDHPNIARVLDAGGTASGRPYFVMELVKGVPITRYCDQEHLTPRERLELLLPVCQAVQHAHQKGIIHRDLKPSNVLIALYDGQPVPKVIDFGIAKATAQRLTERTMFTEVGQVVGTLEYMAPEQAELNNLDIDTRADIYSLGVLLYELLAGSPPFTAKQLRSAAFTEMLRIIREVEPPKPSTRLSESGDKLPSISAQRKMEPAKLTRLVRGELDWIVMKALEKDRGRRYGTANGFARDIQRYLADEAVEACPPSTGYRLRKFIRKHQRLLATGAAILLLLIVAAGVSTWQALRARQAEMRASEARTLAEERFGLARDAVDRYLNQVTETPELKNANFHTLRKQLLESALPFYQKLAEQTTGDPTGEAVRLLAYIRLGAIRKNTGDHEGALQAYGQALAISSHLVHDFPDVSQYRQDLAGSHGNLGVVLVATSRWKEAEEHYRNALDIQRQLSREFPAVPEYRRWLAGHHQNLGDLLSGTRRMKEAEAEYRSSIGIIGQLVHDFPTVTEYRLDLAGDYNQLGILLKELGRGRDAGQEYRRGIKVLGQLADDFPAVPEYRHNLANSFHNLGTLLSESGQGKEAEKLYGSAIALHKRLADDMPAVLTYRHNLANHHHNLGILLVNSERFPDAEVQFDRAIDLDRRLAEGFPAVTDYRRGLAGTHTELGNLFSYTGRGKKAEEQYGRAIDLVSRLMPDNPGVAADQCLLSRTYLSLGNLLASSGRWNEAETAFRHANELDSRLARDFSAVPAYRQELITSQYNLSIVLATMGRTKEAEIEYRRAIELGSRLVHDFPAVPEYRASLAASQTNLGLLLKQMGQLEPAEGLFREALASMKSLVADFPAVSDYENSLAGTLVNLGSLFRARKDYAKARRMYEEALPHHQAALKSKPHDPAYRQFYRNNRWGFADALVGLGDHREAAVAASKLLEAAVLPVDDPYDAGCILARCVPLAEKDKQLSERNRKDRVKAYADQAMAALRQAVGNGYKNAAHMRKDPDLDLLRVRDDFKQLLAGIEAKAKAATAPPASLPPTR